MIKGAIEGAVECTFDLGDLLPLGLDLVCTFSEFGLDAKRFDLGAGTGLIAIGSEGSEFGEQGHIGGGQA